MVSTLVSYTNSPGFDPLRLVCENGTPIPGFPQPCPNYWGWGGDGDRFLKIFGIVWGTGMTSILGFLVFYP